MLLLKVIVNAVVDSAIIIESADVVATVVVTVDTRDVVIASLNVALLSLKLLLFEMLL